MTVVMTPDINVRSLIEQKASGKELKIKYK